MTAPPGKIFQIVGALVLAGIAAGIISVSREPTKAVPTPVVAQKADRLKVNPEPIPVKIETVAQAQPVEEETAQPPMTGRPKISESGHVQHAHAQASDICTRHGMHKVITQGGRSWRCRK